MLFYGETAQAAIISGGDVATSTEVAVFTVPVALTNEPGDNVGGLQFDLDYDPNVFSITPQNDVAVGQAASDAGKSLDAYALDADTLRVLIFGLNQDAIGDGVVAEMTFGVLPCTYTGTYPLPLFEVLVASVSGAEIPSEAQDGSVYIDGIDLYFLESSIQGDGTVSWDPPGSPIEEGTLLTVSAEPALGWRFSHWEGGLSGDELEVQFLLESDLAFTAVFELEPLPLRGAPLLLALAAAGLFAMRGWRTHRVH